MINLLKTVNLTGVKILLFPLAFLIKKKELFIVSIALTFLFPVKTFSNKTILESLNQVSSSGTLFKQGKSLYNHFCAHCHGITGEGDGFNSGFLDKDPANFTDVDFMTKRTNKKLFRVISKGGLEVKKSFLMPRFGNTLTEKEIWAIIVYIRKFSDGKVEIPKEINSNLSKPKTLNVMEVKAFVKGLDKSLINEGEKLFKRKKACYACHKVEEEGGGERNLECAIGSDNICRPLDPQLRLPLAILNAEQPD